MRSTGGPVVVGVDRSPMSEAAVAWAFEEASRRSTRLVAVPAWHDSESGRPFANNPEARWSRSATSSSGCSRKRLAGRRAVPGHRRRTGCRARSPRDRLLERRAEAVLVVVGSRVRGGFTGMVLGSPTPDPTPCSTAPAAPCWWSAACSTPDSRSAPAGDQRGRRTPSTVDRRPGGSRRLRPGVATAPAEATALSSPGKGTSSPRRPGPAARRWSVPATSKTRRTDARTTRRLPALRRPPVHGSARAGCRRARRGGGHRPRRAGARDVAPDASASVERRGCAQCPNVTTVWCSQVSTGRRPPATPRSGPRRWRHAGARC
ncbi:universal stress protein [Amycolatopsis sp. NPDC023774]|uniref:universal stress protein n=1 Tax=Amycolatopsis sp. NPDC023774 TaxID=3155015 RepID=UPI0033E1CCDE